MKKFRRPHKRGRRFYNHEHETHGGFFIRSLRMLFRNYALQEGRPPKGVSCWIEQPNPQACSIDPQVTWLGHASFLIQIGGMNILVDPIFGDVSFVYRRLLPPGIPIDELPPIDFILISHNHRDHMDGPSLISVRDRFPEVTVLTPLGDKRWFDQRRFTQAYEHEWWEQRSFTLKHDTSKSITFSFLPAAHWSRRGFFDKNRSLWGSWMIEACGNSIYFAGDSCYASHFKEIGQEFDNITVALMPAGPCEPRDWLKEWHLGAHEAGQSFLDLGANHLVPMHWGTYPFGVERFDFPIKLIQQWWQQNQSQLGDRHLHCPRVGQAIAFGPDHAKMKQDGE